MHPATPGRQTNMMHPPGQTFGGSSFVGKGRWDPGGRLTNKRMHSMHTLCSMHSSTVILHHVVRAYEIMMIILCILLVVLASMHNIIDYVY